MQSMKETASNIAASAKSGMDKTKATLEEKVGLLVVFNHRSFKQNNFFDK